MSSVLIVAFKEVKVGKSKHKLGYFLMPIMGANINLGDHPKPTGSAEDSKFMRMICVCVHMCMKGAEIEIDDIVIVCEH